MTVAESDTAERVGRVFLSYTKADQSIAQGIAGTLRKAGIVVSDQSSIASGQDLLSAITEAIEASDAVVIVVSESAQRSEWLQLESSLALGSALSSRSKIVLPVSVGIHPRIPSALSRIKALSIEPGSSPENIGAAVLQALRSATSPSTDYLYDSIALQFRALRATQGLEELQVLRSAAAVRGRVFRIAILALTASMLALIAASFILVVRAPDRVASWSWIIQLVAIVPAIAVSLTSIFLTKAVRETDFPAPSAHIDKMPGGER